MNRDLLIFVLVLLVAALMGGFIGAEWTGSTFSPTGAVMGAAITAVVLLGLGAIFTHRDKAKRKPIPPEIKGVMDRMLGGYQEQSPSKATDANSPGVQAAVRASLERKKNAIDQGKVIKFTMIMQRLGGTTSSPDFEEFARIKLIIALDHLVDHELDLSRLDADAMAAVLLGAQRREDGASTMKIGHSPQGGSAGVETASGSLLWFDSFTGTAPKTTMTSMNRIELLKPATRLRAGVSAQSR